MIIFSIWHHSHPRTQAECEWVMGSEAEAEQQESNKIPRLCLFSGPAIQKQMQMQSPERSGMLTPPLHTSASVPFHWEQEPGKPRPCNALVTFSSNSINPTTTDNICLELPPRLLLPSPNSTLFQGPRVASNRFRSPSFKMGKNRYNCYGSSSSSSSCASADRGLLGALVLIKGAGGSMKDNGWWWFGSSWRKKAFKVKREVTGASHVFPSSTDRETADTPTHNKMMKRSGSSSTLSHGKSRVWVRLYKNCVPIHKSM